MRNIVPFEYHIYKKHSKALDFKMSDSLRREYDSFAEKIHITNSNIDNMAIKQLKAIYELMYSKLEKELSDNGYVKSKNTYEELRYIFEYMYMLLTIDSTISQKTLGEVFGLKANDFGKLGIFPRRAYNYYSKRNQDKGCFKFSDAHAIAGVVNEKIQLPYLTRSQVVVSNNPDMFVDLVQGDNKRFFITRPAEILADTLGESMYAHARYCFCNTNNEVGLQKLKDKIIEALDINDSVIADKFLIGVLQSNVNLSDCVRDGNVEDFINKRNVYKQALADLENAIDALEDGDYGWDYDEEPEVVKERAEADIKKYEKQLVSNIAGKKYFSMNKDIGKYKIYLGVLEKFLRTPVKDFNDENTILRLAASYFIAEWFKGSSNISFEDLEDLKAFVGSNKLAIYLDAICKESKVPHLLQIPDKGSLLNALEDSKGISYKKENIKGNTSTEPFLIFVDADAYGITQDEVSEILRVYQVALVIRGTSFNGLKLLDRKLQLYSNVEELHNEYRK